MTTLSEIQTVGREHRISPEGCLPNCWEPDGCPAKDQDWGERHVNQVETCRQFLRTADRPSYRRSKSSYFLKHEVERWRRAAGHSVYVCNGAFIVACWLEGLKPRPENSNSPPAKASPNALVTLTRQAHAPSATKPALCRSGGNR